MKFIFALGFLVCCWHTSFAQMIPIPQQIVPKNTVPDHGYCYRNPSIICNTAGMEVQYSAEDCIQCDCIGEGQGVLCCMKSPFPIVKSHQFCNVFLDTSTCQYQLIPTITHGNHACCIEGYSTSVIEEKSPSSKQDKI
ncbi:hypothetical protein HOLleu_17522 [Holothuria leucospilota]|uniref:Uncharacterized protein n=1 Tax=Holothuria leucospilota TaxID=206669 RepID=A0A9Q1C1H5_HOLLE|nr:hypothetical protein HOLleu_17522 [Holothuria leucospilota]